MEDTELRPPVPPKDLPHKMEHYSSMNTNASKRKREERVDITESEDDHEHTPKRHRMTPPYHTASDTSPVRQSTLRRKKGVNNLSHLNLRHKAEQARLQDESRESKFQEGSLTDKPSQRPPSAYLGGSLGQIDVLMTDYHNGMPTPEESGEERQLGNAQEETNVFYKFGHKVASVFRGGLWHKGWTDSKEESMKKKIEHDLKKQQKTEAEKQYALMKQAGSFSTKRSVTKSDQRDSGIGMMEDDIFARDPSSRTESRLDDSEMDGDKTIRGRLHFKRPSLSNLKFDLKRTKSDINLFGSSQRQISTSPEKQDPDAPELHRTQSRSELKKTHKLSKRVSDLELKLQLARRDLDEALVEASPRVGSKYDRHTPLHGMRKKKFVPGALQTLPSESLLLAEVIRNQARAGVVENGGRVGVTDNEARVELIDNKARSEYEDEGEGTIRASARAQARHVADIFTADDGLSSYDDNNTSSMQPVIDSIESNTTAVGGSKQFKTAPDLAVAISNHIEEVSELADFNDSNIINQVTPEDEQQAFSDQADTPEAHVHGKAKSTKKQGRTKKRKSGELDASYKPENDDVDSEDSTATKKRTTKKQKPADISKKRLTAAGTRQTHSKDEALSSDVDSNPGTEVIDNHMNGSTQSSKAARSDSVRLSIDSTVQSLDPVYEEEEEVSIVPLNGDPDKATAIATPARFGAAAASVSPVKRDRVKPAAEEIVLTRAANAAKKHRTPGMRSPGKSEKYEWPDDVF